MSQNSILLLLSTNEKCKKMFLAVGPHTRVGNGMNLGSPYQNNTSILHRARTNNLKICMEPEKTLNSQRNPEKRKSKLFLKSNSSFQAVSQNCNHYDSMVLTQTPTYRGNQIELNREPTNGPTNIWPTNI